MKLVYKIIIKNSRSPSFRKIFGKYDVMDDRISGKFVV